MNNTINVNGIFLTGKEAITIPCLAIVGAASIMGSVVYGGYKLGEKIVNKLSDQIEKCKTKN